MLVSLLERQGIWSWVVHLLVISCGMSHASWFDDMSLHQRHRFLHRRRRCLRRVRCLLRLHGLWYLLALRRRRSCTIRTSRMSIAFRAVPRPTGNQEICHLLVTSARCHGDTSLVGCSSPLAVWSSRGLFSLGSPGLWFPHVRAHPLPCVDLCIFWFTLVVAAVQGGVQIRGSVFLLVAPWFSGFIFVPWLVVAAVPGGIQIRALAR